MEGDMSQPFQRGLQRACWCQSAPFCRSCTRLRLASNGQLFGCLSSASSHDIVDLLAMPHNGALARLQSILVSALADKQDLSFTGEVTVMKFIGG